MVKRQLSTTVDEEPTIDPVTLVEQAKQFKHLQQAIDNLQSRQDIIKERLKSWATKHGEPDDKGSLYLELPEEVEGFGSLKNERRVSAPLNEDEAERILTEKGLWDECQTTITILDEEKVLAMVQRKKLTEEEWDVMHPQKITWALKWQKA